MTTAGEVLLVVMITLHVLAAGCPSSGVAVSDLIMIGVGTFHRTVIEALLHAVVALVVVALVVVAAAATRTSVVHLRTTAAAEVRRGMSEGRTTEDPRQRATEDPRQTATATVPHKHITGSVAGGMIAVVTTLCVAQEEVAGHIQSTTEAAEEQGLRLCVGVTEAGSTTVVVVVVVCLTVFQTQREVAIITKVLQEEEDLLQVVLTGDSEIAIVIAIIKIIIAIIVIVKVVVDSAEDKQMTRASVSSRNQSRHPLPPRGTKRLITSHDRHLVM